jgi:hypothetical protein
MSAWRSSNVRTISYGLLHAIRTVRLSLRCSALFVALLLVFPFYETSLSRTRLSSFLRSSSGSRSSTSGNLSSSSPSINFFGIVFNALVGRTATNTLATPWPEDAPFGGIRLWDSGTTWWDIQPKAAGSYNWTTFDFIVNQAASNGKDILYTFGRTPQWALPKKIPIISLSRMNNVVTVKTSVPTGLFYVPIYQPVTQSVVSFAGITNSSFTSLNENSSKNNNFMIGPGSTSTTLTFNQNGPDATYSDEHGAPIGTFSAVCTGSFAPNEGCSEAPYNLSDWDNFVTAVVKRANGRIKYWEMWNEINLQYFWKGDKQTMVTMVQHARAIIKSIDPDAVLVSPAVTGGEGKDPRCGRTWISDWLALGGKGLVDVISFHNYPAAEPPEQVVKQVTDEQAVMTAQEVRNLPLWDTESSWGANERLPNLTDQLAFLGRHLILEASLGVQRSYWYAYDNTKWGTLFWSSAHPSPTGLIGTTQAASAYSVLAHLMAGATYSKPCMPTDPSIKSSANIKTWICPVTLANGDPAEAVWYATWYSPKSSAGVNDTTATARFSAGFSFGHYKTLDGQTIPISGSSVTISEVPIILVP